ncbi:Uncharacterised protein [Burkholderia pseudomallei]|nr:Uncharacterised protein [Burkholderia pseudomallei]CAJ7184826.1 Uncharacterised protein [Burkholderia pseudomallei]
MMFICVVLIATVTWSGFGSSSASMWRVSSDSHFAAWPSSSGANEIEPPTWMIMSGTAARTPAISSLNFDSRFEPRPSSSRTCRCSTVAPAL